MSVADDLDVIRGSGDLYRDLGYPDADVRQLKARLACEIISTLDDRGLSVRKAAEQSGVPAADFSRIRNAKFQRFTIDRLLTILGKLDRKIEVTVTTSETSGRAGVAAPSAS